MHTPASRLRDTGKRIAFKDLPKGATFECNGNVWTKHGKQVATGIWPACLPPFSYFCNGDVCHADLGTGCREYD